MSSPAAKPTLFALRIAPPRSARRLVGAGAVAVVVLLWWIATLGAGAENRFVSPVILPSPAEVIRSFPSLLRERALLQSIAATLRRDGADARRQARADRQQGARRARPAGHLQQPEASLRPRLRLHHAGGIDQRAARAGLSADDQPAARAVGARHPDPPHHRRARV